jgi:hypothetical protein
MSNHNQTAMVLVIGLVAVLMTLASTRVFAQPTLPPNEENKVNNAVHADEQAIALDHEHPEGINPPTFEISGYPHATTTQPIHHGDVVGRNL